MFTHSRPHLSAGLLALLIAGVTIISGVVWCRQLEERYIHALAPEFSDEKLQGIALQKEAFTQPDLLMLYGSSELAQDLPTTATRFFQDYPTGFRVFPVGKPGTTALAVAQKIAAIGDDLAGKKVAYSISPGAFFYEIFDPEYYEGNFSALQASELAFSTALSPALKRDLARRMLDFPKTLDDRWLLENALERLAGDTTVDQALYHLAWPLGLLQNVVGRTQDHFEAALHIVEEDEKLNADPKRARLGLNWTELLKGAARFANSAVVQKKRNEIARRHLARASRDKTFIQTVAKAKEWTDIELLMRTMQELGARPLLLSMPVEDIRLEAGGLSPVARGAFVDRLDDLAERYHLPLVNFREHEADPAFLVDFFDHLSAKGWLYYNKALDDFYHGRVSSL